MITNSRTLDPMFAETPAFKTAVLIFPGADILDYAGPLEILSSSLYGNDRNNPKPVFDVHTVARDELVADGVPTGRGPRMGDVLTIRASSSISKVLDEINQFDILIVLGGPPEPIIDFVKRSSDPSEKPSELKLIKAFATSGHVEYNFGKQGGKEKVLLSVCTGSVILGAIGLLDGVESTTHHFAYDMLDQACKGSSKVLKDKRWVDAGAVKEGLRIITSGGVSSGLDSTLYLVGYVTDDPSVPDFVANLIEYERKAA